MIIISSSSNISAREAKRANMTLASTSGQSDKSSTNCQEHACK